jgi:hypothetical protein
LTTLSQIPENLSTFRPEKKENLGQKTFFFDPFFNHSTNCTNSNGPGCIKFFFKIEFFFSQKNEIGTLPEWGSLETVSFLAVTDTSFVRRRSVLGKSADAGLNGEPARETPFENAFRVIQQKSEFGFVFVK